MLLSRLIGLVTVSRALAAPTRSCNADHVAAINVFGLEVVNIAATERRNYTLQPFPLMAVQPEVESIDFCNITITYTHPGLNDTLNVYVWLPFEGWNGRFLGQGGGGFETGIEALLPSAVAGGYATANTDGGHSAYRQDKRNDAAWWSLTSPGNLNWNVVQDFASRALDDLPKIAKQVIEGFYGQPAKKSYWFGCSTGGRQGYMSAQRFPTDYDGIVASAPAINWASMIGTVIWPIVLMNEIGYYPSACEFDAIREAAVHHCDRLDGVQDGVVAAYGLCDFDAKSVVGRTFDCGHIKGAVTAEAADIANAVWDGPKRDGKREWYGLTHDASFVGGGIRGLGCADTSCTDEADRATCRARPFEVAASYVRDMLFKDPTFDVATINMKEFRKFMDISRNEFVSILDTSNPDLSAFKAAGGKIITWHGLADQLIPPNGTSEYYERVMALDPNVHEFYRYFEAPGVAHCFGGIGALPTAPLAAVVRWVEEGVAPDILTAASVSLPGTHTTVTHRPLCPYPLVAAFTGSNSDDIEAFECAESFNVPKRHTEL